MAFMAAAMPYIMAGTAVAGSVMQAQNVKKEADANADVLEYNMAVAREDAKSAQYAAQAEEAKLARQQSITEGKQRSFYGKSGFTTAGTPLAMMTDTIAQYAIDRATTLWNGEQQSNKILSQADMYGYSADAQREKGRNAQRTALLSGLVSTGSTFGRSYYGKQWARETP